MGREKCGQYDEYVDKYEDDKQKLFCIINRMVETSIRNQSVTEKIEDFSQFAKIKKDIARLMTEKKARATAEASA